MFYCFRFQGREVCFEIPVLRIPFPPPVPDPGPWIIDPELEKGIANDLSALATIQAAAAGLSAELRAGVHAEVRRAVSQMRLPAGAEVHLGGEGMARG